MAVNFSRLLEQATTQNELRIFEPNSLANQVRALFKVEIPPVLLEFWTQVGCGFIGSRDICVFGEGSAVDACDSLIQWNSADFWREVFPTPIEGGPIFIAETCFGTQLGFRYDGKRLVSSMLDVDALEAFRGPDDFEEFLVSIVSDRFAFIDPELLSQVKSRLGELPPGMHYAPIVSPLVGGSMTAENYQIESRNVHLRTAIATWRSMQVLERRI